jgi:hypothetical protein
MSVFSPAVASFKGDEASRLSSDVLDNGRGESQSDEEVLPLFALGVVKAV